MHATSTTPAKCHSCNEIQPLTYHDGSGDLCDACWREALRYGHIHGMHVDADGAIVLVTDCPLCASLNAIAGMIGG